MTSSQSPPPVRQRWSDLRLGVEEDALSVVWPRSILPRAPDRAVRPFQFPLVVFPSLALREVRPCVVSLWPRDSPLLDPTPERRGSGLWFISVDRGEQLSQGLTHLPEIQRNLKQQTPSLFICCRASGLGVCLLCRHVCCTDACLTCITCCTAAIPKDSLNPFINSCACENAGGCSKLFTTVP